MVAVSEQQANVFDQVMDRIPGAKKVGGDGRAAGMAIVSVAGVDYYTDAKLRGMISKQFKIDINDPLFRTNTPVVNLLKKKDIGYAAIAGAAAIKNKKAGLFIAGAVLLKRWLESRGAETSGNPNGLPRGSSNPNFVKVVRP